MAESGTDGALITWGVPECPFTIECSPRALDDIRLSVTDAFFSLPRGGAEVGGILLGKFEGARLSIQDYAPLECEHAFGPSFAISLNDEVRLRELLATAPAKFPGLQVVGWYHSHTRSGVFLSEQDLEVHNVFFPKSWHVAMVMKPHTFEPARIGFFFREPDGSVHASASYKELTLEPQAMRPLMAYGSKPLDTSRTAATPRERLRHLSSQVEVEVTAEEVAPEPVAAAVAPVVETAAPAPRRAAPPAPVEPVPPQPVPESPVEHPVPRFLTQQSAGRGRLFVWSILGAVVTLGAIGAAVKTREAWMPKFVAVVRPVPQAPLPPPSLGLRTTDHDGQLEIDWDRNSTPVRESAAATLEISDGGPQPQTVQLDAAHLQAGTFTYGRQGDKVDVKLILKRADGKESREATTFLGKMPERKPPPELEEARKQREEMAAQAAKMKTDLNSQVSRTKKLEKDLQTVRQELRQQQRKRMANQAGDGKQ